MHDDTEEMFEWWADSKLRTILTEPRRHELTVPGGMVLRLQTSDFLSVGRFAAKYLDAVGAFPPLPDKNGGRFLRALTTRWFAEREVVAATAEAGERGILMLDIETALRGAPESDDGLDLERGSIVMRPPAGGLFIPRVLLDRVRRGCPVKFTPSDFYEALDALGCENQNAVRIGHWRGRVWLAPTRLLTAPDDVTLSHEPPSESGFRPLKHAVTPPRDGVIQ